MILIKTKINYNPIFYYKKYPHPRSIESIKNLAIHRGIESGLKNAEAFRLIRSIND